MSFSLRRFDLVKIDGRLQRVKYHDLSVGDKDYLVNSQFVKMVCSNPPE